ncbi:MAG: MBL fold metallo-hydrolase [Peptococcaceae bacterium]|nr:MBL fold metallo-hydrolase [Peptococcaceae bacterium]
MQNPFQIFNRVYLVGGPEVTDERDCCIYLVDGGSELALIDAGLGFSCGAIMDNIKKLGLDESLLKYVIATHGHIDHVGGLHYFQSRGARVACHELETGAVSEGKSELTADWYYKVKYRPVPVDIVLSGGMESITIGNLVLHCPHTPGHTPGGISPYVDIGGTRILFGQDIHGPFDPSWGSDMEKWEASMRKLLDLKADILCEGHFGVYRPASGVQEYIKHYLDLHT